MEINHFFQFPNQSSECSQLLERKKAPQTPESPGLHHSDCQHLLLGQNFKHTHHLVWKIVSVCQGWVGDVGSGGGGCFCIRYAKLLKAKGDLG